MKTSFRVRSLLAVCFFVGLLVGCNNSGTLPVTGKVTKDGQPVAGALVTFQPQSAEGKPASGTTDDSGAYKLTTFVNGDGALPGSYKVTVTKFPATQTAEGGSGPTEYSDADVDAIYREMQKKGADFSGTQGDKAGPTATNELPAKFANPQTSGLSAEVTADGPKTFDFDVTGS